MTKTLTWARIAAMAAALLTANGAGAYAPSQVLELEREWSGPQESQLDHPMGIAITPSGRILVADSGNARLVAYDSNGVELDVWQLSAGSRPVGLAVWPDGRVLVADFTGDRLLLLSARGDLIDVWGETGDDPGQLKGPSGVALTGSGGAIVVEFMGQRVQEFDARGQFVRFIDGGESGRLHAAGRPPSAATMDMNMDMPSHGPPGNEHQLFSFPSDAVIAADGTLYITDTHHYEILVFDVDRNLRSAWGQKGSAAGQWEVPVGLAVDVEGNLYVADSANFRIQGIAPDGKPFLVSRANERWYDSTRTIYSPTGVAVAADGRLYTADFAASRIQVFRIRKTE